MAVSNLARIAFVARHYGTVRSGVLRASFVPWILAAGFLDVGIARMGARAHVRPTIALSLVNIFTMAAAGVGTCIFASRWMDRRFGRVQRTVPRLEFALAFAVITGAGIVDDLLARWGGDIPSFRFLAIAACGLWLVVKLRPYGFHNLLPAAIAFIVSMSLPRGGPESARDAWAMIAYTSTLTAWLVAGLSDLAMLAKFLPPTKVAATEQHAHTV
jgi:hypothetical protein